eukprot:UN14252
MGGVNGRVFSKILTQKLITFPQTSLLSRQCYCNCVISSTHLYLWKNLLHSFVSVFAIRSKQIDSEKFSKFSKKSM